MTDANDIPAENALPPTAPPALVAHAGQALLLDNDGEITELAPGRLQRHLAGRPVLLCHGRSLFARLDIPAVDHYEILELFAFTCPATPCTPTVGGIARALNLPVPDDAFAEAALLLQLPAILARKMTERPPGDKKEAAAMLTVLEAAGWGWSTLLKPLLPAADSRTGNGFDVWRHLPEWEDRAPPPPADTVILDPDEVRRRLAESLGAAAEARPAQSDYAAAVTAAFAPRDIGGQPHTVLAEAGTGIGKTMGYLIPAALWSERSGGSVWISTYTRNLQRQIDGELSRLFPDPAQKARAAVLRKGRENYLCLLNFEEALQGGAIDRRAAIPLALMARWIRHTRDGDLLGGDFPAWMVGLFGPARTLGLADRRGECIYAACTHYRRCFVEINRRKAAHARIVIANHALVMVNAALGSLDGTGEKTGDLPSRYVFDEAHQLFAAADSAFSACLSGREGAELRRWLRGAEGRARSRARGLRKRAEDLIGDREDAAGALDALLHAAAALPGEGWLERIAQSAPHGPAETFLHAAFDQVLARGEGREDDAYGQECDSLPATDRLRTAATALHAAMRAILDPAKTLKNALLDLIKDSAQTDPPLLDVQQIGRIEALIGSLDRRVLLPVAAWIDMLESLTPPEAAKDPASPMVDWLAVNRHEGRITDIGMHRHWLDPTVPFAATVLKGAHGVVMTSATLNDQGDHEDWRTAEARTGASHLPGSVQRLRFPSPFDYAEATRVFVITDIRRNALDQVAAAYRELFQAAGGGGLGIFTAIWRLRRVYERIHAPLERAGLPLYAQHVDPMDTGSLVDIFREQENACLLGTDAVRDGVDVPGRSLRLLAFDRVPWPRPDILHRERRRHFGGRQYDEMLTRLRLKQAYGRLIRRQDDRGVFVILDAMTPSRLLSALPEGVVIRRLELAAALEEIHTFLGA